MAYANIPPMKEVPEGATQEQRDAMYQEYRAELQLRNPRHFNPDGSLKTDWWLIAALIGISLIVFAMIMSVLP